MGITYVLNFVWILMLCSLVIATFLNTIFWNLCSSETVETQQTCIQLSQFRKHHFLNFQIFPNVIKSKFPFYLKQASCSPLTILRNT